MQTFEIVEKQTHPIAYVSRTTSSNPEEISGAMAECFGTLGAFLMQNGIKPAGPPLSIYHGYDHNSTSFDVALTIPEQTSGGSDTADVKIGTSPSGKAIRALHKGPYNVLSVTYQAIMNFAAAENLVTGVAWEYYLNDPAETDELDLLTEVYVSVVS